MARFSMLRVLYGRVLALLCDSMAATVSAYMSP